MVTKACTGNEHRALIVDDEPGTREALARICAREGLAVDICPNVEEALRRLADTVPCLACIDVGLPGESGLELCQKMAQRDELRFTALILVTGRIDRETLHASLEVGAHDFVRKPFDLHELRFRIRSHLRWHVTALRQTAALNHLRLISQAARDAIVLVDPAGRVSHWNEAACQLFGYDVSEAIGREMNDLIVPERHAAEYWAALDAFRQAGSDSPSSQQLELTVRRRDGSGLPIELSLSSMRVDGQYWILCIVRNIQNRHAQAEKLRAYNQQLTGVLGAVPFGVVLYGLDRKVRWLNSTALALLGAERVSDVVGESCCSTTERGCAVCRALDTGKTVPLEEAELLRITKQTVPVLQMVQRVEFGDEQVLLQTLFDIRDRRRLELELRQTHKLEAVGQLAAGIAHEINTPAQYASDNLAFLAASFKKLTAAVDAYRALLGELSADPRLGERLAVAQEQLKKQKINFVLEEVPRAIGEAGEGLERIAKIVRAMKEFSHPSTGMPAQVDLRELIDTTVTVSRNEWKYAADVVTEFDPGLGPIFCLRDELSQAVLNLIVNAAHAIEDANRADPSQKGTITLVTRDLGKLAEIRIVDTGSGIPEQVRPRIFEPFFTTKSVGKGTGQGLAICRSVVVEKHGGKLFFETELGRGTTFVLQIPKEPAQSPMDSRRSRPVPR